MKIKIIELFKRIANGEETPKEFIYRDYVFHKKGSGDYVCIESGCYITEKIARSPSLTRILNEEVEIIEEDKPIEELEIIENEIDKQVSLKVGEHLNTMRKMDVVFAQKINELVKEINKMKEDKK